MFSDTYFTVLFTMSNILSKTVGQPMLIKLLNADVCEVSTFPCCNVVFVWFCTGLWQRKWRRLGRGIGRIMTVSSEDSHPSDGVDLQPVSTAIILEGGIVMDNFQNLPQAPCLLFSLTYALNLKYPNDMKNILNFIQRVMLGLGKEKTPPRQTAKS